MKRFCLLICGLTFLAMCSALPVVHAAWAQQDDEISAVDDAAADAEEDADAAPLTSLPSNDETFEPAKRHVITSVTKCLDLLPKEDAAAIRASSVTPYQDCQKRLQSLKQETEKETKRQKKRAEEPETYRNFKRVSETDPSDAEKDAAEGEEPSLGLKTKSVKKKQKTER